MENDQKKVLFSVAAVLICLIVIFVSLIVSYEPSRITEVSAPDTQRADNFSQKPGVDNQVTGVSGEIKSTAERVSAQKQIEEAQSQKVLAENLALKEFPIASGEVEILVKLQSLEGESVPNLTCKLWEVAPDLQKKELFTKKSDNNGDCLFFKLQVGKKFVVEVTAGSAFVGTMSINVPAESGIRYSGLIMVPAPVAEKYVDNAANNAVCIDNDGENFYLKGAAYGLEPEAYRRDYGANKGVVMGANVNNFSERIFTTVERSVYNDVCLDAKTLNESFCNTEGFMAYMTRKCENICAEGACR